MIILILAMLRIDGLLYMHDARPELQENTLENPSSLAGASGPIRNAPPLKQTPLLWTQSSNESPHNHHSNSPTNLDLFSPLGKGLVIKSEVLSCVRQ